MGVKKRYLVIDALRGIAAFSVVLYHLSGNLKEEFQSFFPLALKLFSFGYLGVPIFFVISGFVIFLSIDENKVDLKYIGNFAIRRSLRLDPTYWFSILFAITLVYIKIHFLNIQAELPDTKTVILHIFYLQDLFSLDHQISVVYWTLCLEIQFYLFFIFSIYCFSKSSGLSGKQIPAFLYFLFLMAILSLLIDYKILNMNLPGVFITHWHYFFLGVVSALFVKGYSNTYFFPVILILELLFFIYDTENLYALTGIVTFSFIYFLGRKNTLHTMLGNSVLQFFGRISYSLYLFHAILGWKIISLGKKYLGDPLSAGETLLLFLAGILGSIVFSYIVYKCIEYPTNKLSKHFR